ncbi:MAG: hypothetical protein ACREOO_00145 [bacterium]
MNFARKQQARAWRRHEQGALLFVSLLVWHVHAPAQEFWQKLEGLEEDITVLSVDAIAGHLFAGSFQNGVFRSIDQGETWMPFSQGLTQSSIQALAIDADIQGSIPPLCCTLAIAAILGRRRILIQ